MQINLSRNLSDTSLISHVSNDREEIDKYNNRPPIKKITNFSEEIEIKVQSSEKSMNFVSAKKSPQDHKLSSFFTGFHHKAYLENVQIAHSKSNTVYRARSTSPVLPPIPYTKKPPQNLSPTAKMPRSPRLKLFREIPQTHNADNNVKHIFTNRTLVSRSTSPLNIQSVDANDPAPILEDFSKEIPPNEAKEKCKSQEETPKEEKSEPEENPTPREDPEQIFHLDQLQEISKPFEKPITDETVTPSKILKHFQFKQSETKGIPKDIPEKLLNRSQRSNFDKAFREIVQNGKGPRFDIDSQNKNEDEEFVKVGQRSRYSKIFQKDVLNKNESPEINPLLHENVDHGSKPEDTFQEGVKNVLNEIPKQFFCSTEDSRRGRGYQDNNHKGNDISETISKQSLHASRKCHYNKNFRKGDGDCKEISQYRNVDDAAEVTQSADVQEKHCNGNILDPHGSSKRILLLDQGRRIRSDDAFYKKVYDNSRSFNLRQRSVSDEHQYVIPAKVKIRSDGYKVDEPLQEKIQGNPKDFFNFVDDHKDRKETKELVFPNVKSSQILTIPQGSSKEEILNSNHGTRCASQNLQFGRPNHIKQSPNAISQLLYCNYGQCTFKNGRNIKSTISQGSFEDTRKTSPIIMENSIEERPLMSNLLENLDLDQEYNSSQLENPRNNPNPQFYSDQTWRYRQQIEQVDVINNSNKVLEARHKVSSTSISFNGPKRPSSVPPPKRHQRKYQNPREIQLVNSNHNFGDKSTSQGKRTLIESIKNKVFPGIPYRDTEELKTWDDPKNNGVNLKFPKETKNAVMMMLSGAKSRVSWKNDEKYQASVCQTQTQIPVKTSCTKPNLLKNRAQLPCPKNLLCEKGLHSGKCKKSDRGMMRYSKDCICKGRRFCCPECQNVWPGSAKRCEEISSEETEPEDAFLQIMEPKWLQQPLKMEKCAIQQDFNRQDLICNFRRQTNH